MFPDLIGPRHIILVYLWREGALVQLMAHVKGAGFFNLALVVVNVIAHQIQIHPVRPGGVAAAVFVEILPMGVGFFQFRQGIFLRSFRHYDHTPANFAMPPSTYCTHGIATEFPKARYLALSDAPGRSVHPRG